MTDVTDQGTGNIVEDDCPLCLEPLPPFWDTARRMIQTCCAKCVCKKCCDKRNAYLDRARVEGSFGREEEQLGKTCPLCRAEKLTSDDEIGRMLMEKFEKGQLPLHMHSSLGAHIIEGRGGVENVERGINILKLGANEGDPMCQHLLGYKYLQGDDGVRKSDQEAKRWLSAAADQGHAKAEHCLAYMFCEEGNYADCVRYLRGSALKGCDEACYTLGLAHYEGKYGLQKSSEEAIRVLTPAMERGHELSMGLLGTVMCVPDDPLPPPLNPNFTKGIHCMRRAAEKGDQKAMSEALAQMKKIEESASRKCFGCDKEAPTENAFLRCSRCRAAWYCSKDCQVQHWKATEGGHKQLCIKWE